VLDTEVLIAGGGPCGLMLALELGRRGVHCLLVDRKPSTAFNPQANATQARTMEHFRRLGLAERVRALGLPADHPTDVAYLTRFAGHELARLRLPTAAAARGLIRSMTGSWSAAELPHRVSQKFVEAVLREAAQAEPGCELRYGWELRGFTDTGEGIEAVVAPVAPVVVTEPPPAAASGTGRSAAADAPVARGASGTSAARGTSSEVRVRAAYLVAADGARSPTRARLGIEWEGATGIRRRFMGGRMLAVYLRAPDFYRLNPNARAWMYVQVHPAQRAFIMSVDGVSEFAFHVQLPDDVEAEAFGEEQARALFRAASGLAIDIEILSMATWLAGHALVASRFQHGRVFLGGDAVHLFTPTGGLGYNTAVEDAVNLGWKLHAVLRGQGGPALLPSYEAERQAVARRNTGYARRFADSIGLFEADAALDDETEAGARARAAAGVHLDAHARLEFNIPGVTFGARYDGSPVIVPDGTAPPPDAPGIYQPSACPGGRPPHAWLADGRSLYDTFGPGWTLLVLGDVPANASAFVEAARRRGVELTVVTHADPVLRALYEAPLALIRPDHIVAWRGADDAQAHHVLGRALGHLADDGPAAARDAAAVGRREA
jgi:2-polyprenyl-6-methoxyphenol hydroxylase-like FAD-dependent oxidoreductase